MNDSKSAKTVTSPNTSRIWGFIKDNILSLSTILVGFGVGVLSGLNIIPETATLSIILTLVLLLTTSELVEGRRKLERMQEVLDESNKHVEQLESQLKNAVQSLCSQAQQVDATFQHGLTELRQELLRSGAIHEVTYFDDHEAALEYWGRRLREARKSIEHAALDRRRSSETHGYEVLDAGRKEAVQSGRAEYNYLAVAYNRRRLDMAWNLIKEEKDKKIDRFHAGFYPWSAREKVPLFSFCIFDGEEWFGRAPYVAGRPPRYVSIKNALVVKLFHDYFDSLWQTSCRLENEDDYKKMQRWSFDEPKVMVKPGESHPAQP